MHSQRISAGAIVEHDGRFLLVRHVKPGAYDFWVSPGGGVKGDESLEQAARREVLEETGLHADVGSLLYIEDLVSPEVRFIKFWFRARVAAGTVDCSHPEAKAEHITQAQWLAPAELDGKVVFPSVLTDRYMHDKSAGFPSIVRLPLQHMQFW